MKKMLFLFLTAAFCTLLLAGSAAAAITEPVKKTVDEVVRIVSDKELKKPQYVEKRRKLLRKAIGEVFDYSEMAQRTLGPAWKERSPAEKKEFQELFQSLLEKSYAGKIESYNNEKIVYVRESVDGDYGEVKSKVITPKTDEFSIDYRVMKKSGQWVVYDVVIEGVSLINNYRGQFTRIIRAQGFPELMKKLRTKSEQERSS